MVSKPDLTHITILTVDDDPSMVDVVSRYLIARGYRVVSTTDPEKVLALAEKEKPRLIISDINMPGLDGLSLLKNLKDHPATRDIPLILLTSSQKMDDVQDG